MSLTLNQISEMQTPVLAQFISGFSNYAATEEGFDNATEDFKKELDQLRAFLAPDLPLLEAIKSHRQQTGEELVAIVRNYPRAALRQFTDRPENAEYMEMLKPFMPEAEWQEWATRVARELDMAATIRSAAKPDRKRIRKRLEENPETPISEIVEQDSANGRISSKRRESFELDRKERERTRYDELTEVIRDHHHTLAISVDGYHRGNYADYGFDYRSLTGPPQAVDAVETTRILLKDLFGIKDKNILVAEKGRAGLKEPGPNQVLIMPMARQDACRIRLNGCKDLRRFLDEFAKAESISR